MFKPKYLLPNGESLYSYCKKHNFDSCRVYKYIIEYNMTPIEAIQHLVKLDTLPNQTAQERLIQEKARIRMYNSPCTREEALLPHNEYVKKMRLYRRGREWTFNELGKKYGINPATLRSRLVEQNMSLKEALSTPLMNKRDKMILKYNEKTVKSVLPNKLYRMINKEVRKNGLELEEALNKHKCLRYFED